MMTFSQVAPTFFRCSAVNRCRDKFDDICGWKISSFVCFVDFFAVSGLVTISLAQSFFPGLVVRVAFNLITFGAVRVKTMRNV